MVRGPLDARVRDGIIAEAHGNPLALLELRHAWPDAEWTGYGQHGAPLTNRLEKCFVDRVEPLPAEVRLAERARVTERAWTRALKER